MNKLSLLAPGLLVTLAALLLSASTAQAGGFYVPPHGVRTMGRGGAGVLGESDMNALWYNPALLAGIEGSHFMLDLTLGIHNIEFTRAPRTFENGDVIHFPTVNNEAAPVTIPQVGYASDFGMDKLVLALGAYAPNGSPGKYPLNGPQRYTTVDTEGSTFLTIEMAAGYQITDKIWVGAGIKNTLANLRVVNVVSGWPGFVGDPEGEDFDILLESKISSNFNLSASAGIRAEIAPGLELGLSILSPTFIRDDKASVQQRLPDHVLFDEAVLVGDTVKASLDLPMVLRTGARYSQERWDVELDVYVEFWSIHDEIGASPNNVEVQNIPAIGTIEVGPLNVPRNYQDALGVSLGGDYKAVPGALDLRAGILWEQSAIPDEYISVLQVDQNKLVLSAGLSWWLSKGVALDLGFAHVIYGKTTITNSEVEQLNPTNTDGAVVVANGEYIANSSLIGLGVRSNF